jgi:plastocyanin
MEAFREARLRRLRRQASTTARAIRAARARVRVQPAERRVDGAALRDLLAGAGAEARLVEIPASRPPWTPTGLRVDAGQEVTWLAWGAAHLVKPIGLGFGTHQALRGRVGGGAVQAGSRSSLTFGADRAGELELASLPPGELREDGSLVMDRFPYRTVAGGLEAVVVRWDPGTPVRETLASLASRDPSGLCAAEAERLADPPQPPPGWEHHPLLWPEEVYAPAGDGIAVDTRETVGIIRKPAEAPLTESLRLRWSWRIDALPSELPEDTLLTHDYLSLALEFDDGQDLTWHWSCALPPGFSYRCPLPHWRDRETHVVARTGTDDLGRWVEEERPVLADHRVAVGGRAPERVVRAWLISVSLFQHGNGRGEFGSIELVDGDRSVRVL